MHLAFAIVAALLLQVPDAVVSPAEREEGFVPLFDGRSLNGWQTIPLGKSAGPWQVRDGVLTYAPGDSWIATKAKYTDFVLRLDNRTGPESDSGIFLRSEETGYPSFTGMEMEIRNDPTGEPSPRSNTSIYGAAAPRRNVTRAAGEWNEVEISLVKRRLVVSCNGEVIHDLNLDDPAYGAALRGPLSGRAKSGHIGFQAHLEGTPVEFRRIRVRVVR